MVRLEISGSFEALETVIEAIICLQDFTNYISYERVQPVSTKVLSLVEKNLPMLEKILTTPKLGSK